MILVIAGVVILCLILLFVLRKRCPESRRSKAQPASVVSSYRNTDVEGGIVVLPASHGTGSTKYTDVQTITLNNSFVPHSALVAAANPRSAPRRRVVAYGASDAYASPLDDCLRGRWVHDEPMSRKQDLVRLLQVDDPQIGDFAVLQNPPGHDLWGIIVVVFSVDGQVKARKTEVVRLGDEGRCGVCLHSFFLDSSIFCLSHAAKLVSLFRPSSFPAAGGTRS